MQATQPSAQLTGFYFQAARSSNTPLKKSMSYIQFHQESQRSGQEHSRVQVSLNHWISLRQCQHSQVLHSMDSLTLHQSPSMQATQPSAQLTGFYLKAAHSSNTRKEKRAQRIQFLRESQRSANLRSINHRHSQQSHCQTLSPSSDPMLFHIVQI